ncbi:MAG TPA: type II toxin-antitoxin system VapC family toxin [Thermoanaerobaculia bacterium]|nr:type II toxin-antitoxin system VapC family toxin [Thermoanaerobaculia bacterium]
MSVVWDASALLLLLQREPGWQELAPRLPGGIMGSINLSEVAAKLMESGGAPVTTREILGSLPIEVHDFTTDLAYRAAEIRLSTRKLGLSLGDRACLALGLGLGLPVLTGDRDWLELDLGVEVELARPA